MGKIPNIEFGITKTLGGKGEIYEEKMKGMWECSRDIKLNDWETELFYKYGYEYYVKDSDKIMEYVELKEFIKDTLEYNEIEELKREEVLIYIENIVDENQIKINGFSGPEDSISRKIVMTNKNNREDYIYRYGSFEFMSLEEEMIEEIIIKNEIEYRGVKNHFINNQI